VYIDDRTQQAPRATLSVDMQHSQDLQEPHAPTSQDNHTFNIVTHWRGQMHKEMKQQRTTLLLLWRNVSVQHKLQTWLRMQRTLDH